ncbi:hypothetical protein ALC60_01928, partial [Trachymyrmex zeteki]
IAITLAMPTHYQYYGPPAPIGHDGRVMDTPEVAHAKAAHLAAVAEAVAKVPHSVASYTENQGYHGYANPVSVDHQMYHSGYGYHGPLAPLDHDRAANHAGLPVGSAARPLAVALDDDDERERAGQRSRKTQRLINHIYKRGYEPRHRFIRAFILQIVLFAFCAIATATPVLDTPEVAQAKAAHLATQAYEAARNTIGYGWPGYGWSGYGWPALYASAIAYGAPIGADGRVIDTPEVAQAKAAHLAAHAQEAAKTIGLIPYGALAYATSPAFYAYAPLGPDGRVIDTPEVAQAKAAHLAAHAAAARNAV